MLPASFCALLLLVGLTACASPPVPVQAPPPPPNPILARQLAWTHTHEVRFGRDDFVSGYLVEFLILPDGYDEARDYPPGTVLLQDPELKTIGMISPENRAYTFDDDNQIVDLGLGGRDEQVAAIFGRSERPHFTAIIPPGGS